MPPPPQTLPPGCPSWAARLKNCEVRMLKKKKSNFAERKYIVERLLGSDKVIKVSIGKAYFVFFFTYFFGNYRCT
jgi:hypothetical protein